MATIIENDLNTDLFPATGDFLSAVHVGEKDYKIKDLAARKDILSVAHQVDINTGDIEDLYSIVAGGVTFRGVANDSNLSDGYNVSEITMANGSTLSAEKGDLVIQGTAEYVWGDDQWYELGHYDQFKELAYHNYTSAAYTPPSLRSARASATARTSSPRRRRRCRRG